MSTKFQVTFDCADAGKLAEFWATALGRQLQPPPEGFESWQDWCEKNEIEYDPGHMSAVVDPEGIQPRLLFIRVPEAKASKNRVHLDLEVSAGPPATAEERIPAIEAKAKRLEEIGATRVGMKEEFGGAWLVMLDPEGNEFCIV